MHFVNLSMLRTDGIMNIQLNNTNILLETPICSREKKKIHIAFVKIEIKSKA